MNTKQLFTTVAATSLVVGGLMSMNSADAKHCDIVDKKSKQVMYTYEGTCDQKRFGGPWGDAVVTEHKANTKREEEERLKAEERAAAVKARLDRLERLKAGCAGQTGVMKELCDEVLSR